MDEPFASGLRNIRHAIESKLGIRESRGTSLGDTRPRRRAAVPEWSSSTWAATTRTARGDITREEVEDCCQRVDAYCVRSKINQRGR